MAEPSRQRYENNNTNFDYYVFGIKKRWRNNLFLQDYDWQTLMQWANGIVGSDRDINKIIMHMPLKVRCLLVIPNLSCSKALYVLCQSYIATHGGSIGDTTVPGWAKLPAELRASATARKKDTERSQWWIAVLGDDWKQCLKEELDDLGENADWLDDVRLDADVIGNEAVSRVLKKCEQILRKYA